MHRGYVCLWRKIMDNHYFHDPKYFAVFGWIMVLANYKPQKTLWNGSEIELKPGQFITGRDYLSKITGVKRSTLERILTTLESGQLIEQQKTTKNRLITVINWNKYQKVDSKVGNKWATNGQQMGTNNNNNNDNNNIYATTVAREAMYHEPVIELDESGEEIEPKQKLKLPRGFIASVGREYMRLFNVPEIKGLYFAYKKTIEDMIALAQDIHGNNPENIRAEISARLSIAAKYAKKNSWKKMKLSTIVEDWHHILDWRKEVEI